MFPSIRRFLIPPVVEQLGRPNISAEWNFISCGSVASMAAICLYRELKIAPVYWLVCTVCHLIMQLDGVR